MGCCGLCYGGSGSLCVTIRTFLAVVDCYGFFDVGSDSFELF